MRNNNRPSSSCFNQSKNCCLASNLRLASNILDRLRGLLGTSELPRGQGLYITRCKQIRMIGMRYPIDAVFIDASWRVVGLCSEIAPGKVSPLFWSAQGCIELPAGTLFDTTTEIGDEIRIT